MKNKGFTLLELLVVIAIIGALSSIAFISLNIARGKAHDAKTKTHLSSLRSSAQIYFNENGHYGTTTSDVCTSSFFTDASSGVLDYTTVANYPVGTVFTCHSSATAYAVSALLTGAGGTNSWCVDSIGNSKQLDAPVGGTYCFPTPPYLTPYAYEYQYQTPYGYQYEYQYQYQTPYSYQYQYQYQYPYPTPPPTPTLTYSGPTSGTYVVGSGSLNLTTPGIYTITINTSASITVKGIGGGGGGERGGSDSNGAAGGGGGGGGAVNTSGLSVPLSSGITYTATVGAAGPSQLGGMTQFKISGSTVYLQLNGGAGGIDGNGGAGGSAAVGGGQNGGSGGSGNPGDRGSNGNSGPTGGGGGGGGKSGGDTSPAYVGGAGGSGSDQAGGAGGSAGGHVCYDDGCDSWGGGSGTSASGSGGVGAGSEGGGGGGGGGGKLLGGGYYGGGGGGGGGTVWPPGSGGSGASGIMVIQ